MHITFSSAVWYYRYRVPLHEEKKMKLMEDMILKEGRVLPGDILKVDSF